MGGAIEVFEIFIMLVYYEVKRSEVVWCLLASLRMMSSFTFFFVVATSFF